MNKYVSRVVTETKPLPKSARVRQAYSMHKMGKTYAYIADILGVSRNRVHQMINCYVQSQNKVKEKRLPPIQSKRTRPKNIFVDINKLLELNKNKFSINDAASFLGVNYGVIWRLIKKHNIDWDYWVYSRCES